MWVQNLLGLLACACTRPPLITAMCFPEFSDKILYTSLWRFCSIGAVAPSKDCINTSDSTAKHSSWSTLAFFFIFVELTNFLALMLDALCAYHINTRWSRASQTSLDNNYCAMVFSVLSMLSEARQESEHLHAGLSFVQPLWHNFQSKYNLWQIVHANDTTRNSITNWCIYQLTYNSCENTWKYT